MKVTILYRPNSEFARKVEEFAHDIERQQNVRPTLVDVDTREGAGMAKLYDLTDQPAVLVHRDSGELVQHWIGSNLPLMNEVAAFSHL